MTTMALLAMLGLSTVSPGEDLPTTLAAEPAALAADPPKFAIGLHLGFLQLKDAEDAEMFYGIHARAYLLPWLALEGSIDFAKSDFIDDDAQMTLVPVQATGLLIPFPDLPIRPYGLAGAGWYFSDVEYSGTLSASDDESDSAFGVHLGFGAEVLLGDLLVLHADFRYIFLDEPSVDNSQLEDEEADYWQLMIGASLGF